ncbi:MAG: hypothetical protein ABS75_18025 [Pelagibacterium sp. SCN 63-23]|nr:MAG: hypothetical protein ABS75_18025 [Pelagibacterium sp. SCN 63-23]
MRPTLPASDRAAPDVAALVDSCIGYLAENPEELLAFMHYAGLDPNSLRAALGTQRLRHGLIDYFAANEAILLALCANAGLTPESFMRVWHKLNRVE